MADEIIVQTEEVSTGEQASTESEKTQAQPLTEARIAQIVAEQVEIATNKAKGEIQSVKDKARVEVERATRRVTEAEGTVGAYKGKLSEVDPEAAATLRLGELEQKERFYRSRDATEAQKAQATQFDSAFVDSMNQFITGMGLDPTDKRIDWGTDAADYLSKQGKILASISQINKENTKASEVKLDQKLKDEIAKTRRDLGLDSVDLTTSAGVVSTPDTEFLEKFGKGEIPYNKANRERAEKLMK